MYFLFKLFSPSVSVRIFYLFLLVSIVFRFLFRSVYGVFLVSILIYGYVYAFTEVEPYSVAQLVEWVDGLGREYKVAFISSGVTIAGFAIAFHTATINWRSQMRAQLMLQVSSELEGFFSAVSKNIITAKLYVEGIVAVVNEVNNDLPLSDVEFSIDYIASKEKEFLDARSLLSEASVEVHRLLSKNYTLLASNWESLGAAQHAASSLNEVARKIWIDIPVIDINDPGRAESFVRQVNVGECEEFISSCERSARVIGGLIGGVGGQFHAPIVGFNLPMFVNLLKERKEFQETMGRFHKDLNLED